MASYVFYMSWNAAYIVLIVLSTVVDFIAGHAIDRAQSQNKKRLALLASLATNLGLLFTFKYWHFFHTSLESAAAAVGLSYELPSLSVLLPVGISFYTFQTLSYTVDIYRGQLKPEPNPARFALFVSFFPQLVAGPIERAKSLLPQLRRPLEFNKDAIASGATLIAWALRRPLVHVSGGSHRFGNAQMGGLCLAIAYALVADL